MHLFTAICIIAVTSIICGCLVAVFKAKNSSIESDVKIKLSSILERLSEMERRMSDVETLIVEKDKERKYNDL
jgi:hypothetical protein